MSPPNILLIMCDQLRADVLGCYGGAVPTPPLDRLAREGARFTEAICPLPVCSPSRASIITGMYPHHHGIVHNVNRRDYPAIPSTPVEEGIRNADVTTERLLHEVGYATHHYGKWHLLDEDLSYYPDMFTGHGGYAEAMKERFAEVRRRPRESWMNWYGWALPVQVSSRYAEAVTQLGDRWKDKPYAEFVCKMGRLDLPLEETFDFMVADRVVACLNRLDNRPFMLTCSFNMPHDPNVVPSPYYEMFDPNEIALPQNFHAIEKRYEPQWSRQVVADLGEVGAREFMQVYYAAVKLIDDQVGRVLTALEQSGRADDTIVVFTSDHGDMCGGHGMVWKSTDAFYEEVVRVPLIVRCPRLVAPRELNVACNLVDLMPTLLELTGQSVPNHVDGISLARFLRGERQPADAPAFAFCERLRPNPEHRRLGGMAPGHFMVRGCGWKYCLYANGEEMLFNLIDDPGETSNLASEVAHNEIKRELRERLEAWLSRSSQQTEGETDERTTCRPGRT